eukprot:19933_1
MSRRRRIVESSDESEYEESQSQSASISQFGSPLRRSNRNRNVRPQAIVIDSDDNEPEFDTSSEEDDNDAKQEEAGGDAQLPTPKLMPSVFLPMPIARLGQSYSNIDNDIQEVALGHLIDTATDFAEFNKEAPDYDTQTKRLEAIMDKLLSLSKDYKIETLMLDRMQEEIGNGALDDNENDDNPIKSGDWDTYFGTARDRVLTEIESEGRLTGTTARVKQKINRMKSDYELQFKEAIQRDEIEDPDHNHNNRNESEDSSDEDIIVEAGGKNTGSTKCPLTTRPMENPWKARVCGHTFEKDAILEYITGKNRQNEPANCPLPGCSKVLSADEFTRDIRMIKLIKAQKRQQEAEQSEEDEDQFDFTLRND